MEKMKLHSPNLTEENIIRIREMFPGCVTEAHDENGKVRLAVDFDQLRQELSDRIVEGPQERYHLNWPGKRESLIAANAPIAKTLRPARDESVNFDTTQNLFIEGDNLEALKLLQEIYLGKIKMIYIDPPYNTGNDFVYEDDFSESNEGFLKRSNQKDELGNRLVANSESNGRFHSDWLTMMFPRIKVAKNLLREDGVMVVSIDDGEYENIKKVLDETLGSQNFIGVIARKTKLTSNKGRFFAPSHEYLIFYARSIEHLADFDDPEAQEDENYLKLFRFEDEYSRYNIVGLYQPSLDSRPNQRYFIECPDGSFVIPPGVSFPKSVEDGSHVKPNSAKDKVWRWSYQSYLDYDKSNLVFLETKTSPLLNENGEQAKWNVYTKIYLKDRLASGMRPVTLLNKFPNSEGSKELLKMGIPFEFSKPKLLLVYLMRVVGLSDGGIVLDFFAGSGTTAHAVLQKNAEDGDNANFILIQLDEETDEKSKAFDAGFQTISDLSKERLRRAGAKVLDGKCHSDWNKDIGFRVLKIDTSNMKDVYYAPDQTNQKDLLKAIDNIKPDRTPEDLLFQVLVDWGVDLTLPIRRETVQGKTVFFVDKNALVACFDTGVTEDLVKELADHKPLRVVFRDTGFVSDAVKINVDQIFRQLSPATDVKSI